MNVSSSPRHAGFDGIELNYDLENDLSPKASAGELRAIRKTAEEIGIAISGLCSFLYWPYSLTDNDAARRARALELAALMLEAAHELGTENLLTIAGSTYIPWLPEREPVPIDVCARRARESIGKLVPLAEKLGVNLNIENIVFNGYLTTPDEMNAFVDSFGSKHVHVHFDTGNVMLFQFPEHWIPILGRRIQQRPLQGILQEGDRPHARVVSHLAGRHNQLAGRDGCTRANRLRGICDVRVLPSVSALSRGADRAELGCTRSHSWSDGCTAGFKLILANARRRVSTGKGDMVAKSRSVRIYDSQAPAYREAYKEFLTHTDQKIAARRWLDDQVRALPAPRVFIDAGAGTGTITAWYVNRFERTIAIEPNAALRDDLRKACGPIEVLPQVLMKAQPNAQGDLVLCSHVLYYIDPVEWMDHLRRMSSWLSASGALFVMLQNHETDYMQMLNALTGRQFHLAELGEQFRAEHGGTYTVSLETVPAHVASDDLDSAYTIAEFMLNLVPLTEPISRAVVEEFIRTRFTRPGGGYRSSCHQDVLIVRHRRRGTTAARG